MKNKTCYSTAHFTHFPNDMNSSLWGLEDNCTIMLITYVVVFYNLVIRM